MHELFTTVLSKRDLSKAGDLFSVSDSEIVDDLTEVITKIEPIISQPDYLRNNNDQSVVEICITRVLSCIRETKTAEKYCSALVGILEVCLKYNLQPTGASNQEDPPHAKISADIISSIFLNYDKKEVMKIALPVAIKFLQKGNKELSRNLASYLSLAAIDYAYLLSPHVDSILNSIISGNYGLCRVLPQIYEVSPDELAPHASLLVSLLHRCDAQEKLSLLQLFTLIAEKKPTVLESSIPQLCEFLLSTETASATMRVLLKLAENRPNIVINYFDRIRNAGNENPSTTSLAAQVLATSGKINKDKAQIALDFVLEHLPHADRTSQTILLHEATKLCSSYPVLFTDKVLACVRQKNSLSQQQSSTTTLLNSDENKTSGGVTIVKLNSSSTTNTISGSVTSPQSPSLSLPAQQPPQSVNSSSMLLTQPPPPPPPQVMSTSSTFVTQTSPSFITSSLTTTTTSSSASSSSSSSPPSTVTTTTATTATNNLNHHNVKTIFTTNSNQMIVNNSLQPTATTLIANRGTGGTVGSGGSSTTGHVVTIHTSSTATYGMSTNTSSAPTAGNGNISQAPIVPPTPPHTGYTRRVKLGDSRSTGRLHPTSNTHRSMTRLNIAGGSVGGLHKSMTRLSSSQQINQQNGSNSNNTTNNHSSGNVAQQQQNQVAFSNTPSNPNSPTYVTPVPPLSSNVIITGHNKWGIPATTKISSGGVTVTTSPPRIRPHSQGPITLLGSTGALGKYSIDALNQSTGSIAIQQNSISVHHVSPASPTALNTATSTQKSVMTLPINTANNTNNNHEVIVSGPMTVTSRRNDNTSVTLLNANNSIVNQRMSTFEPYQIMRDPVQQFCEKNFSSIKCYMDQLSQHLPPPTRCSIEERRTKKVAKLHFACQVRGPHCLYSKTCFTMRTRNPKTWIHLMFLDFQVRYYVKEKCVLSTREPGISNLKNMWQILKCENRTFTELVTSHFPSQKDREILVNELRHSGFLDVFEVIKTDQTKPNANELEYQWGCFLCNHPDKVVGFLRGNNQPMIEGQLKEKKGKWRLFRRWRTRYFTLSGAHLSCKGSSGGESIDVNQIRSVKVSRGARNIPKAFEIFTGDQTLILKPKDGKNAEEWVQCLSIAVAHSQARDNPTTKTNSLPARGIGNSRTTF